MCNICDNIKNKSYLLTESIREELRIGFIDKVDDYIVNQYYIYCVTENCNIGYPIQYCPICGKKLK
mgnify:FL=1